MFSRFRDHFGTGGLVVAVAALVIALAGGAYAATGALTGKQKKEVEKIAKKVAPKGTPGATGPAGSNGTPGPAGSNGKSAIVTKIPTGKPQCEELGGALVEAQTTVEVCNGEEGEEGQPWTPNGTLPSGATETGAWAFSTTTVNEEYLVPISFTIPLAADLSESKIHFGSSLDAPFNTICKGTVTKPTAPTGELCIYLGNKESVTYLRTMKLALEQQGTNASGAAMVFNAAAEPVTYGAGSWAVTG